MQSDNALLTKDLRRIGVRCMAEVEQIEGDVKLSNNELNFI